MKFLYTSVFLFTFLICQAQNQHSGVLYDSEGKEPLEFANIFNATDNTISNVDGQFSFSSKNDSVIFYRVGYDKLETTFEKLKDTIFLNKSVFELNEVVVTNQKKLIQIVTDSLEKNYPFQSFKERFLLRGILKINDTLVRLQDIQGKVKRKTLFFPSGVTPETKDYQVELTNMRQIGIVDDTNGAYFVFPSFYTLFNIFAGLNFSEGYDEYHENYFENVDKVKLEFNTDPNEKNKNVSGYYIINLQNNAVEEFYLKSTPKNPSISKSKSYRYKTTSYDVHVFYDENSAENKYHITSAKFNARVEATNLEKTFESNYDISFIMTTFDNFGDFKVKKNVKVNKDIFKLKYPYNASYWKSQNQLLLTDEMNSFISAMGENNKEFKVRSNFD